MRLFQPLTDQILLSGECMRASRSLCRNSSPVAISISCCPREADRLTFSYRSIPTKDQVLVPETLLKKRKSQDKERAEKQQQRETKKKVSLPCMFVFGCGDDIYPITRLASAMLSSS